MGISWSSSRRRSNYIQNPPPPPPLPPPPPPYFYHPESHHPPPPPPPPPPLPPQGYFFPSTTPYTPQHCTNYLTPSPLPPQPPPSSFYYSNNPNYPNPSVNRLQYNNTPYYVNQPHPTGWAIRPSSSTTTTTTTPPPPPYVDSHTTKKIRNYVNVHKDTLRLEVDQHNPDQHLISFIFDAVYDGSITIFYCAKEEAKCRFVPLFPDAFEPITIPFQKGVGQKFAQPSGTGIDLGFFELDHLSKPSPGEDVFPLVICAKTCVKTPSADETSGDSLQDASPHMQITQGVLEKSSDGDPFQIKVVRQLLWIDGYRYELRELYGIGSSAATDFDDDDPGKECVICMTEPKDTAVLPCRHLCMCSKCAKALRLQSNKCPICRQSIEELMEINVNNGEQ